MAEAIDRRQNAHEKRCCMFSSIKFKRQEVTNETHLERYCMLNASLFCKSGKEEATK